MEVTQCDRQQAEQALLQSNGQCKVAIVMLLLNMSAEEEKLLGASQWFYSPSINFG